MLRRLFTVASAVLLVLCLATAAMWVRSANRWDRLLITGRLGTCEVMSEVGFLDVSFGPSHAVGETVFESNYLSPPDRSRFSISKPIGLEVYHLESVPCRGIKASYWLVVLVLSCPAIAWLFTRLREHRRVSLGRCSHCGYDLRASPDRCPECGHVAEKLRT